MARSRGVPARFALPVTALLAAATLLAAPSGGLPVAHAGLRARAGLERSLLLLPASSGAPSRTAAAAATREPAGMTSIDTGARGSRDSGADSLGTATPARLHEGKSAGPMLSQQKVRRAPTVFVLQLATDLLVAMSPVPSPGFATIKPAPWGDFLQRRETMALVPASRLSESPTSPSLSPSGSGKGGAPKKCIVNLGMRPAEGVVGVPYSFATTDLNASLVPTVNPGVHDLPIDIVPPTINSVSVMDPNVILLGGGAGPPSVIRLGVDPWTIIVPAGASGSEITSTTILPTTIPPIPGWEIPKPRDLQRPKRPSTGTPSTAGTWTFTPMVSGRYTVATGTAGGHPCFFTVIVKLPTSSDRSSHPESSHAGTLQTRVPEPNQPPPTDSTTVEKTPTATSAPGHGSGAGQDGTPRRTTPSDSVLAASPTVFPTTTTTSPSKPGLPDGAADATSDAMAPAIIAGIAAVAVLVVAVVLVAVTNSRVAGANKRGASDAVVIHSTPGPEPGPDAEWTNPIYDPNYDPIYDPIYGLADGKSHTNKKARTASGSATWPGALGPAWARSLAGEASFGTTSPAGGLSAPIPNRIGKAFIPGDPPPWMGLNFVPVPLHQPIPFQLRGEETAAAGANGLRHFPQLQAMPLHQQQHGAPMAMPAMPAMRRQRRRSVLRRAVRRGQMEPPLGIHPELESESDEDYGSDTTERPFACRFCGDRFSQEGYVSAHERIHVGDAPFKCMTCGDEFVEASDVQIHQKAHKLGIPVPRIRRGVAKMKPRTTSRMPWRRRSLTKKVAPRPDHINLLNSATTTSSDPASCSSPVPDAEPDLEHLVGPLSSVPLLREDHERICMDSLAAKFPSLSESSASSQSARSSGSL